MTGMDNASVSSYASLYNPKPKPYTLLVAPSKLRVSLVVVTPNYLV